MPYYLGLDLSTQSLTGVLIDPDGERQLGERVIGEHSIRFDERFPHYGTSDGVIRGDDGSVLSPAALWLDALDAFCEDLVDLRWPLSEVAGIAVSGQQHATVYLDAGFLLRVATLDARQGLAAQLSPCLTRAHSPVWLDQSTEWDVTRMREELHGGGLPDDYVTTTSGSDYALRFPAAQIARFARTESDAYARTARIHLVSSFLTSVLAGRDASLDFGDGAGTNLIDCRRRNWDPTLLDAAAPDLLPRLPALALSTEIAGRIAPYFERRFGFPTDVSVLLGTGDNPSSLIGCGASQLGSVVVSLGTSDTAFAATRRERGGDVGHIFGNPAGGWMQLVCFTNGSLARERIREQCGLGWEQTEEILQRCDLSRLPVFLPYLEDEISPRHPAVAPPEDLSPSELIAGFCLSQTLNLYLQAGACLGPIDTILLTGGASRNDGLAQLYADVFQARVERLETTHSAALGAAKRAWQACTQLPWEHVDAHYSGVVPDRTRHPRTHNAEAVVQLRRSFERLLAC